MKRMTALALGMALVLGVVVSAPVSSRCSYCEYVEVSGEFINFEYFSCKTHQSPSGPAYCEAYDTYCVYGGACVFRYA